MGDWKYTKGKWDTSLVCISYRHFIVFFLTMSGDLFHCIIVVFMTNEHLITWFYLTHNIPSLSLPSLSPVGIIRDENTYSESPFDMMNMSEPGLMTTAVQVLWCMFLWKNVAHFCDSYLCLLAELIVKMNHFSHIFNPGQFGQLICVVSSSSFGSANGSTVPGRWTVCDWPSHTTICKPSWQRLVVFGVYVVYHRALWFVWSDDSSLTQM